MTRSTGTSPARATLAYLRQQITSGTWPVNSKIPTEPELAATLGVGRTTIREAVSALAGLGMLEPAVGRGTFVRSRTPVRPVLTDYLHDFALDDVLSFRRAIEVEAAREAAAHRSPAQLAALRATHEADLAGSGDVVRGEVPGQFHALVVEASGSVLLVDLYAGILAALRPRLATNPGAGASRTSDHARVLAAIERSRPVDAALAMAEHVSRDVTAPPGDSATTEISA